MSLMMIKVYVCRIYICVVFWFNTNPNLCSLLQLVSFTYTPKAMKGRQTFRYRQRQRPDPPSANKGHQVPAVRPDLYDQPRKNTKRLAVEGDYFEGVKVRRVILSEASDWEISQVDNTEFDEGWDSTLKFMEEFEARTAHFPRFGEDTPEVCSDSPCSICLRKGHSTCACPYNVSVPYGATVSRGYEIVCKGCNRTGDHQHTFEGVPRGVVMKLCVLCHTIEDHWPDECRMKKN